MKKSRQALNGKIVHVSKHVAIYKINASPFWRARIWMPSQKKRMVRSTKTKVRITAMQVAEEFARELSLTHAIARVPKQFTFEYFAENFLKQQAELVAQNQRHPMLQRNDENHLHNERGGLIEFFGKRDVREIQTRDIIEYLTHLREHRPDVKSSSTFNHILSCFRKVMMVARDQGVISSIPSTPRPERKEEPRSFFRFHPLVEKERDQYKRLLETTKKLAAEKHRDGSVVIKDELYEFILWMTHTFMRPTASEAFAVRFQDVETAQDPKRLLITLRRGKTGYRVINSLPAAVSVFNRLSKRKHQPSDYLFQPTVTNRSYAAAYTGKMFRVALKCAGIERDLYSSGALTLYSLRHTAICMRLVLSEGKVNIFNLAKNAGTSVDQIERFYARNLPLSAELARNLNSFGDS
jgi:integrase